MLNEGRVLDENVVLIYDESPREDTQDLRNFYLQMLEENDKNLETIEINSSMNSDNSQTTGNDDTIQDIQLLLPTYEIPIQDKEISEMAKEHQQFVKRLI